MKYNEVKHILEQIDRDTLEDYLSTLGESIVSYYSNEIDEMEGVLDDLPHFDRYEIVGAAKSCGVQLSDIVEAYAGEWNSDEDFARELVTEIGDFPEIPNYIHIDWESTARDLMMDYSSENGYYFRAM